MEHLEELVELSIDLIRDRETKNVILAVDYVIKSQNAEDYIDDEDREYITLSVYSACESEGLEVKQEIIETKYDTACLDHLLNSNSSISFEDYSINLDAPNILYDNEEI